MTSQRSMVFAGAFLILIGAGGIVYWLYKESRKADILILNGTIITMDAQRTIIPDGALAIRGNTIIAVGSTQKLAAWYKAPTIIDATHHLILPGLIDGHTHAAMTLLRGLSDDASLCNWLNKCILPVEKIFADTHFVECGTKLACLEMIQGGITTAVDMYMHESAAAQAFANMGMRAIAGIGVVTMDDLQAVPKFVSRWQGHPLITPAVAPHSPYSCTTEVLTATYALAQKLQLPIAMHIAESTWETETMETRYKMRPIAYLEQHGFLTPGLIAVHMVHLNDQEIALIKERNVHVVYNPTSNMKLASGVAPISKMLTAGIIVGLGTDGAASNNRLDLMSEMKCATLLQKVANNNPKDLDAYATLEMATSKGAEAIGLDDTIGTLEVGKRADIIGIQTNTPHMMPLYEPISQIVYAAKSSDVTLTLIEGKVLMQNRKLTYDTGLIEDIYKAVTQYQKQITDHLRKNPGSTQCVAQTKNRLIDNEHKSGNKEPKNNKQKRLHKKRKKA